MREGITGIIKTPTSKKSGEKLKPGETVNINTADFYELIRIPYVSKKTASYILQYRDQNGKFNSVDDLLKIKGIGKKKLEKIKPYIRLE